MSDIQQARDLLAKWRGAAHLVSVGPWAIVRRNGFHIADDPVEYGGYIADVEDESMVHLIVGTAGNPELLDAIDEVLRVSLSLNSISPAVDFVAHRFARAILAADERMSA